MFVPHVGVIFNSASVQNLCDNCQRIQTQEVKREMLRPGLKINNRSYVNTDRQNKIDEFIIRLSCKDLKTDFSM